jgi:hypothetical protein
VYGLALLAMDFVGVRGALCDRLFGRAAVSGRKLAEIA